MLDWLKTILGDAYTDDLDKKISQEIGKGFVARQDFNDKNNAVKQLEKTIADRDGQLEALKNSTGDVEGLKSQIAALQQQNKADKEKYDAEILALRMDNAVEKALTDARARNVTAAKALLADFLKTAKLKEDGSVDGLAEQIEKLVKDAGTSFLFASAAEPKNQITGLKPGDAGGGAPPAAKAPKDMTYDELCAYLEANPGAKLT